MQSSTQFHLDVGHVNTITVATTRQPSHCKSRETLYRPVSNRILLPRLWYERCFVCAAFLRILGVTLVNPCQSPPKPCHRKDPGDDESISYEMQDTHLSSSILVHFLKQFPHPAKRAVECLCLSVYGRNRQPNSLSIYPGDDESTTFTTGVDLF